MPDDKSTSKKEVELTKDAAKKIEDQKKYRKHVEETLKECSFTVIDEKQYSLLFNKEKFVFHLPTFLEKTQIQAIIAKITYNPVGTISGELDIESSGDLSLRCRTKLFTCMCVLSDQKDYDLDDLNESEVFNFGYSVLLSEQEFINRKKKVSTEEQ